MSPGSLLDIDRALALILERTAPLEAEEVASADADGRYLAEDLRAAIDLPPFTNSAMDGYALRSADTPGTLAVAGESAAGRPAETSLTPGAAITISTGAALPDGADAVVPIEATEAADETGAVRVPRAVAPDANVRHRGSDISAGAPLLSAGARIGPAQIAALISAGHPRVHCRRRPRVAILATGSELRPAGEILAPGEIYDSNGPMLAAALRRAGAVVTVVPAAADTVDAHREAFTRALEHDVVISSGGVSVGPHDLVRGVGAALGVEEVFWRVALRPGKPLSFGTAGRTLVFGLPGNPVSTLVCWALFVAPAVAALQGAPAPRPAYVRAPLATAYARNPERDEMIRVIRDPSGGLVPARGQQSHQISITALADGLARIPAGSGDLPAGSTVDYLSLSIGP
ncbi:gephyrin-like molybdotransferase Glp [Conexibacter sp. DBS9H8]|uniref:molybdopterin molybdotransferase MoeA n=1 Tax=Conexibacter sp. DBS9H8 TaxID=2937801 RepID=UPI00200EDAB5|nr:gephyrin-like molybdotransferase Glp [Conexibacter sp. DBS9H8]